MTIDLTKIQERAYATAVTKGWHERPLRQAVPDIAYWKPDGTPNEDWPDIDHDRVLAKLALVHSEIAELTEAYEQGSMAIVCEGPTSKPEGFGAESADVLIRCADLCAALGLNLADAGWLQRTPGWASTRVYIGDDGDFYARISSLRKGVDKATEAVRVDDWSAFVDALGSVVALLAGMCSTLGVSLSEAIEVKMAYNDTRPHRHGGKKA